ncbi:MAG TPA: Ldh family oxidoreductase [Pirellulales bacterium]|nr:Ldh family oxidoreductase [Pirellulales bacterium]
MPTIPARQLTELATKLLAAGGVGADEARLVAESLVGANLRGHDSHGVMRIPFYLDSVAKGETSVGAPFTTINESPTTLVGDGGWGFGQTQAHRLTNALIGKARTAGTGLGTLVRCGHIGRLGEYCEQAADAGLVSMVMVNTHGHARRVAPPGGKAPRLGTNPLAIGAPADAGPLVLDFGTSATAEGKVRVKRIAGQLCPDGWLLDADGKPTNDPNSLYGNPPGTILPMGGPQAYKGFGLALMVEIFAGALSGGVTIREKPINQNGNCVFMLLVDPAFFGGREHFAAEVSQLTAFVRGCPRIDGVAEIQLPGDPERRVLAERTARGIPLDEGNWRQLTALAEKLKVTVDSFPAAAGELHAG